MSKYESADGVEPLQVTTYRLVRKAARRGWAVPGDDAEPSLADLVSTRANGRPENR